MTVKELLASQTDGYVEELLFPHFGALMNFVKECEPLVDQGHTELLRRYTGQAGALFRTDACSSSEGYGYMGLFAGVAKFHL